MKMEKKHLISAKRLAEALADAGLKAQDLADKTGIGKASISHYLNGYYCPGNIKAKKMADVLGVNPVWLMGFDVPKEPDNPDYVCNIDGLSYLIESYKTMDDRQRGLLKAYIELLKGGK